MTVAVTVMVGQDAPPLVVVDLEVVVTVFEVVVAVLDVAGGSGTSASRSSKLLWTSGVLTRACRASSNSRYMVPDQLLPIAASVVDGVAVVMSGAPVGERFSPLPKHVSCETTILEASCVGLPGT